MRYYNQSIIRLTAASGLALTLLLGSCKIEPIEDPNNPGLNPISQNPTKGEIQNVVTGIESGMRNNLGTYGDDVGVIGREFYRFSGSDPRFTSDLLGKGSATLDDNTFYTTNPFAARYRVIKNSNILIDGLTNTTAAISAAEKTVGIAYAKTIQAHELLMVLNLQYGNGVRVDVANPDALGPFLTKDQSLDAILGLLNSAYTDLTANASVSFPFITTLNGPGGFAKFNRALAARVSAYKSDWNGALTALSNSFFDINGDLKAGVFYLFSIAGGDQVNPMFYPLNSSGETRVAHPSYVADAEAGDSRLNKVSARTSSLTTDGLTSSYDFFVYKTNVDKIPIIRNEELLLIYAEAKIQLGGAGNLADAKTALDKVRAAAGLAPYAGSLTQAAMIDEMLKQRRYALYGEGHRWIDLRRYNRLNTLPIDRTGDDVWVEFPRPAEEL
ncbi:MAG TPA: RagB/SusD family nutrient uptake outer membrane protein [Chitinophagaceae bacterium]|nr:RagB/SusD family nutrient uptake outer membrane protein [Chitinophagaceae bacterium]